MSDIKDLIPLNEITDEAGLIAVAWVEGYNPSSLDIGSKHKLASDIMNYAASICEQENKELREEIKALNKIIDNHEKVVQHIQSHYNNVVGHLENEVKSSYSLDCQDAEWEKYMNDYNIT